MATLSEDEKYLTIEAEIPRQVKNEEDMILLEDTMSSAIELFQGQFAMTFALNLLLKGVMSQLWNIFNTLQIILALPLLAVEMPSNV